MGKDPIREKLRRCNKRQKRPEEIRQEQQEREDFKMSNEKTVMKDQEKEFMEAYMRAPAEWRRFIWDLLRITNEGHGMDEALEIIMERGLATPYIIDRAKEILASAAEENL